MRKNQMSKCLTMILTIVMALSLVLAGCGTTQPAATTAAATTATPNTTTAVTTATTQEVKAEPVHLKWALWDISLSTYYEPLINAYQEANKNVTIEMVDLGGADYPTVLSTQMLGFDSGFDLVSIKDIPQYGNLVKLGLIEQVDTSGLDLSVYDGITDQITLDGKLYALPFRSDFWLVFYNKDIFDAAGVPYPSNDMTFSSYMDLAAKVTKTTLGSEVYGAHYHTWRSTASLFGILDGQHTVLDGNYDFMKPYYESIVAAQSSGVCQDYATLKTNSIHYSGAFANGNIAMLNMGTWFIPTLISKLSSGEYVQPKNWGLARYPHPDGVEAGSTLATITSMAVTVESKQKEAATDFMKFVCGTEGALIMSKTGTIPAILTDDVVKTIASQMGYPADEQSADALRTTNKYIEMPLHEKSAEINTILNDAHDYIMTGNKTVDEGIAYANEEAGKILN